MALQLFSPVGFKFSPHSQPHSPKRETGVLCVLYEHHPQGGGQHLPRPARRQGFILPDIELEGLTTGEVVIDGKVWPWWAVVVVVLCAAAGAVAGWLCPLLLWAA